MYPRLLRSLLLGLLILAGPIESFAQDVQADASPTSAALSVQEVLAANAPDISARIDGALSKIGTWVEATGSFAVEQTPLLIQEIIYFELAYRGFWVLTGLLGMFWAAYAWRYSHRNAEERLRKVKEHTRVLRQDDRSDSDTTDAIFTFTHYAVPLSGVALGIGGAITVFAHAMSLIKPLVAPRLFLIEYFRTLMG